MDFHTHSNTSFDSKMSLKELIDTAKIKGIKNLCVTNHYEPKSKDLTGFHLTKEKLKKYTREIKQLQEENKGKINIFFGVEVGYDKNSEEETRKFLEDNDFDFVIGSNHFVKDWWISSKRMISENQDYDYDELMELFFESLKNLIKSKMVDVIGHIDIVRKTIPEYKYENHIKEWKEIVKLMREYAVGFEINTSLGRIKKDFNQSYPETRLKKLLIDEGITTITLGSDAHRAEHLGCMIPEAIDSLKELGIKKVCLFKKRKKEFIEI